MMVRHVLDRQVFDEMCSFAEHRGTWCQHKDPENRFGLRRTSAPDVSSIPASVDGLGRQGDEEASRQRGMSAEKRLVMGMIVRCSWLRFHLEQTECQKCWLKGTFCVSLIGS